MSEEDQALTAQTKLTRGKDAWARDGGFLTGQVARPEGERPPPGRKATSNWPVLGLGLKPEASREDWKLRIDGLVGQPLSAEHGGPVRLVVPHLYFWKSAKWLRAISFHADDQPGFWELRGDHNRGDPWAEQRYWR